MSFNLCASCGYANPLEAGVCQACGEALAAPRRPPPPPPPSRAQRRAAVRRTRIASELPAAPPGPPDVLVLDANDSTRAELCQVLHGFGFRAFPARSPAEARTLLAARGFVAVFLDIVFDGTASDVSADLCQRAREPGLHVPGHTCALIVIDGGRRPVDRVRASMAGADQVLIRPASRGAVARALDACGMPLPSDPRRNTGANIKDLPATE